MASLSVPAHLDSLAPLAEFVVGAATAAGIERKPAYRLRLAVDEIATNIVLHGYEENGMTGEIIIRAETTAETLTITLEDKSPAFDPFSLKEPDSIDRSLEDRPIGGLGVFLAVRGVDEYRYEYRNGANCNIFTVQRPPQE